MMSSCHTNEFMARERCFVSASGECLDCRVGLQDYPQPTFWVAEWGYSWIPLTAGFVGGVAGGALYRGVNEITLHTMADCLRNGARGEQPVQHCKVHEILKVHNSEQGSQTASEVW